ncbi:hypothetical protein PF002_g11693 [Phytophthora fragariae]|uniref:Secreted protein n=1 Tax=Phytophthora fragariae TaxID=53985 RepID=A0A6A4EIB7_9STRA|nr:hypothetical protein PF003_g21320 [Phytophthora fragariae]KAE9125268.1 hypothetical protein PF006_g16997 [Phytophthora fragariae]KAE9234797.1 hypothetical protein PF002_g11693 [Phytophthora fragariae]KAE9326612.1 hypothetical protein PF001_g2356 [Phytophthora fragariae]
MSLLLATLYYCLLSLPVCACPYFCRACTTVLQPDLRGVIKILPRRVLVGGVRVGAFCSTGFARRGLGLVPFAETGVWVDSSDDYASHWILAPCPTVHHPCRIFRRAVAPIKPRRVSSAASKSITHVRRHPSRRLLPPAPGAPTSSAGYYTTVEQLPEA